jgi:Flp pilus assembly protein TadB
VITISAVALALVAALRHQSGTLAGILLVTLIVANAAVLGSYFRWRQYRQRLSSKLQEELANDKDAVDA